MLGSGKRQTSVTNIHVLLRTSDPLYPMCIACGQAPAPSNLSGLPSMALSIAGRMCCAMCDHETQSGDHAPRTALEGAPSRQAEARTHSPGTFLLLNLLPLRYLCTGQTGVDCVQLRHDPV